VDIERGVRMKILGLGGLWILSMVEEGEERRGREWMAGLVSEHERCGVEGYVLYGWCSGLLGLDLVEGL